MPEFHMNKDGGKKSFYDLPEFVQGYIECIFFTETDREIDDSITNDDGYYNISEETLQEIIKDCEEFQKEAQSLLELAYQQMNYDESYAGHDFWLNRNGHGVGFWNREALRVSYDDNEGYLGDKLSELAKHYQEKFAYKGEDGLVYLD